MIPSTFRLWHDFCQRGHNYINKNKILHMESYLDDVLYAGFATLTFFNFGWYVLTKSQRTFVSVQQECNFFIEKVWLGLKGWPRGRGVIFFIVTSCT